VLALASVPVVSVFTQGWPLLCWAGVACAGTVGLVVIRGGSRALAWTAAVSLALTVSSVLASTVSPVGRPPTATPPQVEWASDTLADRSGLPMGDIYYRRDADVTLGEPYQVSVWVCGKKSSCPPSSRATPRPSGPPGAATKPIPIGARLKASLTASDDTTVELRSASADQLVLTETDAAEWLWRVRPVREGRITLRCGFVVLRANTEEPLFSEKAIELRVRVKAAPKSFAERARGAGSAAWSVADKLLATAGTLATLVATVYGVRALFRRKKKKKKATTSAR
jgi:hypothetical protein